ncbi:MAG TPA: portal protein, partial [Candidatus Bathyarchaeia archaeon]|nr:portal protein [Candidatus Bathyarchaeia archaeon]
MPTGKDIIRRFEELRDQRGTWDAHFQEIADYGVGRRDFSTQVLTKGRKRQHQIFDNSFMQGGEMLSAGLHSLLSNPATRWFRLKLEDDRMMEIEEVAIWVQLCEQALYRAFNRPEAAFSASMHEAYTDIVYFGTGGIFIEDAGKRKGAMFMSAPLSNLYIGEDEKGRLDTYMWTRRMSARQIVREYGEGVCERADTSIRAERFEEEYEILRAVFPREDPMIRRIGSKHMPWSSYHVE